MESKIVITMIENEGTIDLTQELTDVSAVLAYHAVSHLFDTIAQELEVPKEIIASHFMAFYTSEEEK